MTTELPPDALRVRCDPESLGFDSTQAVDGEAVVVGQGRAVEALTLGVEMKARGFNVFVIGPTGTGRNRVARAFAQARAATEPVPPDRCYVHCFEEPRRPHILELPPGQGARLRDRMDSTLEELASALPTVFESQQYRDRREAIEHDIEQRHEREIEEISEYAQERGVGLVRTPAGLGLVPVKDGEPMSPEDQEKLPKEEQEKLQIAVQEVHARLHEAQKRVPRLQREQRESIHKLDREVLQAAVDTLLAELRRAFSGLPAVQDHFDAVERDIVEHTGVLLRTRPGGEDAPALPFGPNLRDHPVLRRYRVNLLVNHRDTEGAPVVCEEHPTSSNLIGKIEHVAQLGVLMTDFNLIEAGALHRAHGGYLLLDARRLLSQPASYEQLKRVLRSGEIRIESLADSLGFTSTVTLEPEPAHFDGKVILIGEAWLYHRLSALDPEFEELFKVAADFEPDMPRTLEGCREYAHLIARVARGEDLLPLRADAVARIIDHGSRLADDATRVSMQMRAVFDLMREANHAALADDATEVAAPHVERAIAARDARHGRLYDRVKQTITEGTLRVDTEGERVGQINALSVVQLVQASFGFPTRVTATTRLGHGELVDIEREIDASGPGHSKGVLILQSLLGARYLPDHPLSLRASLTFEQMYGAVDGDSASLAELLALLSSIGEVPLRQTLAVTGSIDQHGNVQPVGGINEKVEGFFDICKNAPAKGQGVIIPATNAKNLMLREEVIDAVKAGSFRVCTVGRIEEAMELMSGLKAAPRGSDGRYPSGSFDARVEGRLEALAKRALSLGKDGGRKRKKAEGTKKKPPKPSDGGPGEPERPPEPEPEPESP